MMYNFVALPIVRHRYNPSSFAPVAESLDLLGIHGSSGRHLGKALLLEDRQDGQLHVVPDPHQRLRVLRDIGVGRGGNQHFCLRRRRQCLHQVRRFNRDPSELGGSTGPG